MAEEETDKKLPRGRRRVQKMPSGAYTRLGETIDVRCPPRQVRHLPTQRCTAWSTLFRKRAHEFAPHFRTKEEEAEFRMAQRRFTAHHAFKEGDPYAGYDRRMVVSDDPLDDVLADGNAG